MTLSWQIHEDQHPFASNETVAEHRYHAAESSATEESAVKDVVEAALAQAETLLDRNVTNASLFFMVTWSPREGALTLSVTDADKAKDAPDLVTCRLVALNEQLQKGGENAYQDFIGKLQFWIKDYLSTSTAFMNYSLVAVFTDAGRDHCQIV